MRDRDDADPSRVELTKFHAPAAVKAEPKNAPVNTLGIRRIMFAVDDIDGVLARLRIHGAELVGEVAHSLTWAVTHKDQLRVMGERARAYVNSVHSWDRIGEEIDVLYRHLQPEQPAASSMRSETIATLPHSESR